MKFIVDAQLPKSLARFLKEQGFDTLHTLDLPLKNATGDNYINQLSIQEQRIVISKDSDFYDTFMAKQEPYKLLYLTVGNMRNIQLIALFANNLATIVKELQNGDVVEINATTIITIK
jgi:predicted nuclease of predicted toxin-antitoxin system